MSTPAPLSPIKQRLLEKLLRTEAQRQLREAPIEPRPRNARIPLAPCQHQIWLHAQLNPQAPIYNAPVTLHFHGALDRAALERALEEMIQRHEIWRTTFAYIDGQVVQAIHDRLPIEIPFHDLTSLPIAERESEAIRLATADAYRPFDLGVGPLMRARVAKLADDEYRLFLVQHHLIHDGVTIYGVLMTELPAIYEAFSKGEPSPLPMPELQYADFALWQKRFLDNDTQSQVAYWRAQLAGDLQPLDLPSDRPRPPVFSFKGATADFTLSSAIATAVRETARQEGVTPFAFLLAAFKTLLFRYTGQEDILVGTFTDTRPRAEFAQMAGFLMNTIVLRSKPSANRTFREYLKEVKGTVLDGLAHRDVPLDRVLRDLRWSRDPGRHPLFEASFTLVPALPIRDSRWKRTESEVSAGSAKWDIDLQLDERDGGYAARVTYSTDLFDRGTIERMFAHFTNLLQGAIANPAARLIDLPLLTQPEIHEISLARNATAREIPSATVSELFEEQASRTPSAVAIECGDSRRTYAELNRESNRLAHRLQQDGAGPGMLVALCVERSAEMVVAILAILKTGAAYLPIDPEIPKERQQFILDDSGAPLLLTEERIVESFRQGQNSPRIVCCSERAGDGSNPGKSASPDDIAHVLYTSGSTGKPKGVEVPHRAVVNFLNSMRRQPGFTASDKLLAVTTISFDIAGLELYLPLICGGRVILARGMEARDPALLQQLIRQHTPTVMQATPATWRALIEAGWTGSRGLKILCGGEALPRDLAEQMLTRSAEVWNMYGPTETTIWSTIQRVMPGDGPVAIGRPIDNTQVYVLNAAGRVVPDGVLGELYIGGKGVARGYRGRPELTSQRFVQVEAGGDARLYRTGDLARWRNDGALECRGRADNQVKIRGFRVELEEIEAVISQHPDVRGVAVKAWPDASGHLSLAGYLVTSSEDPDIRGFLRNKLPDYMIPAAFVHLDRLPLTPNLKIDRNRLPSPEMGRERAPFAPSENDTERQLAGIWEAVLEMKDIGMYDDFFRSGGHSLLVSKLLSRVEQTFGVRLPMTSLFEAPTIREFAKLVKNDATPAGPVRTVAIRKHGSTRPITWLYPGVEMRGVIEKSPRAFLGVALSPQDEATLPQDFTLEQVAAHLVREIRTTQPEGPYNIGGWCSGGILAYEVASQLRGLGCEVDLLVLLDAVNPVTYLGMGARRRGAIKLKYHFKQMTALRPSRMLGYLRDHMSWARDRLRPQTVEHLRSYEKRFSQAILKYAPPSYPGRVLVLTAERLPSCRDPQLHWRERVTGDLDIRRVAGDHISMFQESPSEIALAINSSLVATETQTSHPAVSKAAARA